MSPALFTCQLMPSISLEGGTEEKAKGKSFHHFNFIDSFGIK